MKGQGKENQSLWYCGEQEGKGRVSKGGGKNRNKRKDGGKERRWEG